MYVRMYVCMYVSGHKPYLIICTTISGCWEFLISKTVWRLCIMPSYTHQYVYTCSSYRCVRTYSYTYVHAYPLLTRVNLSLYPKPSQVSSLEQYAMRSYSDALDSIPMALADNAGLSPIYCLSQVKSRQIAEKNPRLGIDCMQKGNSGMLHCTNSFSSIIWGVWNCAPLGECLYWCHQWWLSHFRHESPACDWDVDWEEAAVDAGHTASSDDLKDWRHPHTWGVTTAMADFQLAAA